MPAISRNKALRSERKLLYPVFHSTQPMQSLKAFGYWRMEPSNRSPEALLAAVFTRSAWTYMCVREARILLFPWDELLREHLVVEYDRQWRKLLDVVRITLGFLKIGSSVVLVRQPPIVMARRKLRGIDQHSYISPDFTSKKRT